jgi:protein-L-isoaspartate(D-aspartate) O-methyltransferase
MFAVVGEGPVMNAMLVTRSAAGEIWKEKLFETVLPPLDEAPQPSHFVF